MREKGAEGSKIVGGQRRRAGKSIKKRGGQREGIRKKWRRKKKNLANVSTRKRESQVCNGQICAHS